MTVSVLHLVRDHDARRTWLTDTAGDVDRVLALLWPPGPGGVRGVVDDATLLEVLDGLHTEHWHVLSVRERPPAGLPEALVHAGDVTRVSWWLRSGEQCSLCPVLADALHPVPDPPLADWARQQGLR